MIMQEPMDAALKMNFWQSGTSAVSSEDLLAAFLLPGDAMTLPGCIDIVLDKDDGDKVRFLCNDSAALVFNFYGTALSILLSKYLPLKEFLLMPPRKLFEDTQGEEDFF